VRTLYLLRVQLQIQFFTVLIVLYSVAESDSYDAENGFDEVEVNEVGAAVTKFVTRFIDKVCNISGVTAEHNKALHQMVPG